MKFECRQIREEFKETACIKHMSEESKLNIAEHPDDKHNWDGYIVDGKEYRLTKEDCLTLQGFNSDFKLCGSNKDQWNQFGKQISKYYMQY